MRRLSFAIALAWLACGGAEPPPGVAASPDAVQPLAVGETVPSVSVRSVDGAAVDLADVADDGALLVFYRGGW